MKIVWYELLNYIFYNKPLDLHNSSKIEIFKNDLFLEWCY